MFYSAQSLPKIYRSFFKEEFSREELEAHLIKEVEANTGIHEYLSQFNEASHEKFVSDYAKAKAEVILELSDLRDDIQSAYNDFTKFASERIWDIQQKKLFDLQCKWRAEQITIPEIQSTWDFKYWERDIKLCPFISPLTADDIDLYRSFLENSTEDLSDFYSPEWQSYDDFKPDEDGDSEEMPQWYEYHNNITGAGMLLSLPDIRGEKEEFYNEIWRNEMDKSNENKSNKPYVYFSDERNCKLFLEKFETKQFIKNYNEFNRLNELVASEEETEDAVRFLLRWHEEIPIKENKDWRKAIMEARQRFINFKTAEALASVYDEYKMRQDLSLPHKEKPDTQYQKLIQSLSNNTLEGRKINGDPMDFNF